MWRLFILTCVILVLVSGCGTSPDTTFNQFVKAVEFQHYSEARDLMSAETQEFLAGESDLDLYMDSAHDLLRDGIVLIDTVNNGLRAEFKYRSRATGTTATATLVLKNGKWEVREYRSLDELLENIGQ